MASLDLLLHPVRLRILQEFFGRRTDVTFTVFPPGNHLLAPGQSPSSPAEYVPLQHVDPSRTGGPVRPAI